jgi:hypothetical protein
MAGSPVDILTGIVEIRADQTKFDRALDELRGKASKIPGMLEALGTDRDIGQKLIEMHNRALASATDNMLKDFVGGKSSAGLDAAKTGMLHKLISGGLAGGAAGALMSAATGNFGGLAQALSSGGGALGGAIGTAAFGPLGGAVGSTVGAIPGQALAAIPQLVQAFNPVAVERFNYILKDVTAVIGDRLQPVLETVGVAFRLIGDVLETILPSQAEMAELMKPINEMFHTLREAIAPLAPLFREMASVELQGFVMALDLAAKSIHSFAETAFRVAGMFDEKFKHWADIMQAEEELAKMKKAYAAGQVDYDVRGKIGGIGKVKLNKEYIEHLEKGLGAYKDYYGFPALKSSVGKGFHGESSMMDARSYYNQLAVAAVTQTASPEERTAKATEWAAEKVDEIHEALTSPGFVAALAAAITNSVFGP